MEAAPGGRRGPAIAADAAPNATAARTRAGDGVFGNWPTGSGVAANPVGAPLAVDGLLRRGLNGRPVANALIEAVHALSGDGLPLRSTGKNADPATLLRVRGDAVMLLWRYPF